MLKEVSRSFYLTLRMLPEPMREAACLGYLLARTSDTLADTAAAPVEERMACLERFARHMTGGEELPPWPSSVMNRVAHGGERRLLERSGELFAWLGRLPPGEAELVREVVGVITGGQQLDLERFAGADRENPVALADDAALEDYAWRVAGCVGAFWTKLGFLTMGDGFSKAPPAVLIERGIAYGKGLQLVNILRDVPEDLANGRCYLPVADPRDTGLLMRTHGLWLERAAEWIGDGFSYAETLRSRRLRAATVLPAMIARETLALMCAADWEALRVRVKVPRSKVYLALARALTGWTD